MNRFFSSSPLGLNGGLALIRIILGAFLIYHGLEIFNTPKMNEYMGWDLFNKSSIGKFQVYLGKGSELAGGILFVLGLWTRIAALLVAGTMAYVTFVVGHGKLWYEDQYPFLFALLAMVFFFTGPGAASADKYFFSRDNK